MSSISGHQLSQTEMATFALSYTWSQWTYIDAWNHWNTQTCGTGVFGDEKWKWELWVAVWSNCAWEGWRLPFPAFCTHCFPHSCRSCSESASEAPGLQSVFKGTQGLCQVTKLLAPDSIHRSPWCPQRMLWIVILCQVIPTPKSGPSIHTEALILQNLSSVSLAWKKAHYHSWSLFRMEKQHSGADFTGSHIYSSFHLVPEDYFLHFLIVFFPSRETSGKVNKNMAHH